MLSSARMAVEPAVVDPFADDPFEDDPFEDDPFEDDPFDDNPIVLSTIKGLGKSRFELVVSSSRLAVCGVSTVFVVEPVLVGGWAIAV